MSTVNTGEQLISFAYGQEAESLLFNRLNYQLHASGIYDGGELTKASDSTATLSKLTAYLVDSPTAIGMRVQTTQEVTIDVSDTSKPYIVIFFDWQDQFANYADITTSSWDDIGDDYIILGKCEYDGSDNLQDFDLTRRDDIIRSVNQSHLPFWVKSNEPFDKNVLVNAGNVLVESSVVEYASDQTVGPLSDTTDGRIDLIYIDADGTLKVLEGSDEASPSAPDYGGRFVLAEVSRGSSRTDVKGSDITNIRTDLLRQFSLEGVSVNDGVITSDSLTPSRMLASNASKEIVSIADLTSWIAGTVNKIEITNDGDGSVTVSIPSQLQVDSIIEEISGNRVDFPDGLRSNAIESIGDTLTVSGNLTITGDVTVSGTTTTINTATITTEDNIFVVNDGETGAGVTNSTAGMQVDRGTEIDYFFVFDDIQGDTFRIGEKFARIFYDEISGDFQVGEIVENSSDAEAKVKDTGTGYIDVALRVGEFQIGDVITGRDSGASGEINSTGIDETDNTQAVATREDSPVSGGVAYWDTSSERFDTISDLTVDNGRLIANEGVTLGMASSTVAGTIRWNSGESEFEGYDGSEWGLLGGGGLLEVDTRNLVSRPVLEEGSLTSSAEDNTIIGYNSGESLTDEDRNIFIGNESGRYVEASSNIAIGFSALQSSSGSPYSHAGAVAIGNQALKNVESNTTNLTAIGNRAGEGITTGSQNTVMGAESGRAIITGQNNVAVGDLAMASSVNTLTGSSNTAIGSRSLYNITSDAASNVAVGKDSSFNLTTARSTISIGVEAGYNNETAWYDVAVGYRALKGVVGYGGGNNVAIGKDAMENADSTSNNNIAIGTSAGVNLDGGINNILLASNAGLNVTSGSNNIAFGSKALAFSSSLTGDDNIAFGGLALSSLQGSASNNIAIGADAGDSLTTGSRNIFIGKKAGSRHTTESDVLVIDNRERADTSEEENEALIYGIFADLPENQEIHLNARIGTLQGRNIVPWEVDNDFISSPRGGDVVYRNDVDKTYMFNGDVWVQIG